MSFDRRFRWLLRLLPGSFREEHERELLGIWRHELRDADDAGRQRVWLAALSDTLRVAPREFAAATLRNISTAIRALGRAPAFAIAAIITLAVGTGATAAVFTLVNAVLLRPLPFANPDRVGIVWPISPSGERTWLSFPELEDLARDVPALDAAGMTDLRPTLLQDGIGHELQALAVSHRFFAMLGVRPAMGRDFTPTDDRGGAAPAVLLGDAIWRARFGASSAVVGSRIRLNDRDYEVIGVLPANFSLLPASSVLPEHVDVWLPLEPHLPSRDRSVRFLHVLARLRGEARFEAANAQLRAYASRVQSEFVTVYRGGAWQFTIVPFAAEVLKQARLTLWLMFGLVTLVLLIACANVANLLLARGEARREELSIRTALGAGPARLAGELFAEALVLTAAGGAVGLGLAIVMPSVLRSWDSTALPRLDEAGLDWRVGAFMALVIVLCAIVVALVPMLERARLRGGVSLASRSGGRTRRSARAADMLVVVQTALATTVIVTMFFLFSSLLRLHEVDLGFDTDRVLTARVSLAPGSTAASNPAQFFDAAIDAVRQISGVNGAAAITQLPLSGAMLGSTFFVEPGTEGRRVDVDLRGVTTDYFDVAGITLVRGRGFDDRDRIETTPVAIVDDLFARRLRSDAAVVGQRIRWFRAPDVEVEIIGVVRSLRHRGPGAAPRETVYRPHRQYSRPSMFLVARTPASGMPIAAIRAAISNVDPTQPVADVMMMSDRLAASTQRARTSLLLAGILSTFALGLAVIGLYGVLSFGVARRRREFGVRLTLGSTATAVRMLVLKEGLRLTLIGLVAGAAGAAAVAVVIRGALFGTGAFDLRQYAWGFAAVTAASIAALWFPARRASAVDPIVSLRTE